MKAITSNENPKIKEIIKMKKALSRNSSSIFIEGQRLCLEAYASGIVFETLLFTQANSSSLPQELKMSASEILLISPEIATKISSTVSPQGVFAVVRSPVIASLLDIELTSDDRMILCDAVRDPGNMGSIIRSADAFGLRSVIFTADSVDPFNEKVIRASMGSVFHIKLIYTSSLLVTVKSLQEHGVTVYATDLQGEDMGSEFQFQRPCAIIVGNEAHGVDADLMRLANFQIRIPMEGKAESLNVASAAAVLSFMTMNKK